MIQKFVEIGNRAPQTVLQRDLWLPAQFTLGERNVRAALHRVDSMPSIRWTEYEATQSGVSDMARKLCLGDDAVSIDFRHLPHHIADFEFGGDGRMNVAFPTQSGGQTSFEFYTFRVLSAVPLMHYVRRRYPNFRGRIRLDVEDMALAGNAAFCSNSEAYVLVPDSEFMASLGYQWGRDTFSTNPIPWVDREDRVVWRGVLTGQRENGGGWETIQRARLCLAAGALDQSTFDVGISQVVQVSSDDEHAAIKAAKIQRPRIESHEFHRYRYLIDIDGNSCAWSGLFIKLMTGSTVLKVGSLRGYRQWYYDRLVPWVNFVPVASDLSDLESVVARLRSNPTLGAAIGRRGQELALKLTYDDVLDEVAPRVKRLAETIVQWG